MDTPIFTIAFDELMLHEGGYVDDPSDTGGATKYGLSLRELRKYHKMYDLDGDGDVDADDIRRLTPADAKQFYFDQFWNKYQYNKLPFPVSKKIFNLSVNMGPKQAHKCLQRALRACDQQIEDDGILGPLTQNAVRLVNLDAFGFNRFGACCKILLPSKVRIWG